MCALAEENAITNQQTVVIITKEEKEYHDESVDDKYTTIVLPM